MKPPLAIELFCGLGGWAEGFLAEGYGVIGFDIERHDYGNGSFPGQLVVQDVLTLDGAQFRNEVKMSIGEMDEWKAWKTCFPADPPNTALFDACFRIQREASEAAARPIPLVVENVKGAQPWVGPARAHFGSFYLWSDIDSVGGSIVAGGVRFGNVLRPGKRGTGGKQNPDGTDHPQDSWLKIADSKNRGSNAAKNDGGSWFNIAHNTESGHGQNPDGRKVPSFNFHEYEKTGKPGRSFQSAAVETGRKQQGSGPEWFDRGIASLPSHSSRRKAASAEIAKIPFPLAQHIAACFKPVASTNRRPQSQGSPISEPAQTTGSQTRRKRA